MPVEFSVTGIPELQAYLERLSVQLRETVEGAMAEYFVGDESHGLKHEVAYRYVSRTEAYGQPFVSDRQRRYVMARIHDGTITPGVENRTHQMAAAWDWEQSGGQTFIRNEAQGVEFVEGDQQARQPDLVGWRKYAEIIQTNIDGALRAATQAINRLIHGR